LSPPAETDRFDLSPPDLGFMPLLNDRLTTELFCIEFGDGMTVSLRFLFGGDCVLRDGLPLLSAFECILGRLLVFTGDENVFLFSFRDQIHWRILFCW